MWRTVKDNNVFDPIEKEISKIKYADWMNGLEWNMKRIENIENLQKRESCKIAWIDTFSKILRQDLMYSIITADIETPSTKPQFEIYPSNNWETPKEVKRENLAEMIFLIWYRKPLSFIEALRRNNEKSILAAHPRLTFYKHLGLGTSSDANHRLLAVMLQRKACYADVNFIDDTVYLDKLVTDGVHWIDRETGEILKETIFDYRLAILFTMQQIKRKLLLERNKD